MLPTKTLERGRTSRLSGFERELGRAAWLILGIILLALLSACGGTRRVLGAPGISVQEIELIADRYVARVRLDSPSSMPLVLKRFDWKLSIDGKPATSGSTELSLTLAPVAGDVARIDLGASTSLPRLGQLTSAEAVAYVLEGELQVSEPNVRFPLRYEGRLRPTPGKPGSFR